MGLIIVILIPHRHLQPKLKAFQLIRNLEKPASIYHFWHKFLCPSHQVVLISGKAERHLVDQAGKRF